MSDDLRESFIGRIEQALREGWPDDPQPGHSSDEDFLKALLASHKTHGSWRFASCLELLKPVDGLNDPELDQDIALNLYGQVLDTARSIGRARKLLAEREVAAGTKS